MLYKITFKDSNGNVSTCYMDDRTLKSMTTDSIVDVEKVDFPQEISEDKGWDYENKIF